MIKESVADANRWYDVCIIGSGPAGGVVANELAGSGQRVCVLESGIRKPTPFADALRELTSEGIQIKAYSRERVLGGSSTTWAGLSSPFDEIDFARRSWVSHSGWPISRDELLPFYAEAERYRFPALGQFDTSAWARVKREGSLIPEWTELEEKVFLAAAEPQNFGTQFLAVYDRDDTDLILNASVIRFDGETSDGCVSSAVVANSDGSRSTVRAKTFVLAANGIENARLLLNSTFSCPAGLGNEHDQVGRYFMNHPKNYFGTITLKRRVREMPAYFGFLAGGFAGYLGLRLREDLQRERRLLNSYIRFEPMFPWSDNPGVEAAVFFTKRLKFLMKSFRSVNRKRVVKLRDYSETGDDSDLQNSRKSAADYVKLLMSIPPNLPDVSKYLFYRVADKLDPNIRAIRIRNFMEMEPHPENRIMLSDERDAFGTRRPKVLHNATELDRRTMAALHESLERDLRLSAWGSFDATLDPTSSNWPINLDASHHMGSTRMGHDPRCSVVDPQCRVHSTSNVFIAGASVLPTSGNANPTFTLVALAIRLAQHLRKTKLTSVHTTI